MTKLFSTKSRPVHLGPFPMERIRRTDRHPALAQVSTPAGPVAGEKPALSIAHAISRYQAMLDIVRDGQVMAETSEIPDDPVARANHLKAAGYYFDATMMGVCRIAPEHWLDDQIENPATEGIRDELRKGQPKVFSGGIDQIFADIEAASQRKLEPVRHHTHAIAVLVEYTRDIAPGEPGHDWIAGTQAERAALLTSNTAILLANYLRLLGHEARAHSLYARDVDLNRVAVSAGLAQIGQGGIVNPFLGGRFGLAVVTTTLDIAPDRPIDPHAKAPGGLKWRLGYGSGRSKKTAIPYEGRSFHLGPYPFEKLKRVDRPTTYMDEENIPRPSKRADFFARTLYGDLGKPMQDAARGGMYIGKNPIGACARRALGALLLLQYGEARGPVSDTVSDPVKNSDDLKAASYYLSCDAVGMSRCPDWAYYSHNAGGEPLSPYHGSAISLLFDQGHETMEGASGDDWISGAQSMRAYLRFSLIGGVIAEHIRRLGYSARVHSVLDSEVVQPPLVLLAGLGEVSRIGDAILSPFLGPRIKSGTVTSSIPMAHDKPIDFGMQNFCESCLKCARECPSGAISAGPKLMYNGYEMWRSDPEKCTRYRITNAAGAMCGRCMKTCPWNFEGLFTDNAFRWMVQNLPASAKKLAELDDIRGRGTINPVKKWWWDLVMSDEGSRFVLAEETNKRELQRDLKLKYEDQTLAAYPANLMPQPWPVAQPIDRDKGVEAYRALISAEEHQRRKAAGEKGLVPARKIVNEEPPMFPVVITKRQDLSNSVVLFEFARPDGTPLPEWDAGAHIDIVVAPEYLRQYSLSGDPADNSRYQLGIQREEKGKGGSKLLHQVFKEGRTIFISKPHNHFPLDEDAELTLLMGGGIGVTPMIAMAHRLHALGKDFVLHYSARSREQSGFAKVLQDMPWAENVAFHFSSETGRADLDELIPTHRPGMNLYTCGGDAYMASIFETARQKDWPENDLSREYFSVPEQPDRENFAFEIELKKSGRVIEVPAEKSATDALAEAGIHVDTKCSDGICGVCACNLVSGEVDHRDFVLSAEEREKKVIPCCSRAAGEGARIVLDL
ncbi:2Fe-2S iron-sulfur cluster-binding protein [Thalassovita aquimarina]|uniref:2Fe-2S iron-sulfur cluster-binding protein n=1 Tax=Thalassovita aquimarina TaxID=2785917 RepID=UPI0031BB034A